MSTSPVAALEAAPIDWLARAEALMPTLADNAARHDADDSFVAGNYARLKAAGFFGAHVPIELGGGGADYPQLAAVIRRLGTCCGSTALTYSMHSHLVAVAAWRWRNQNAPTDGLLRRVASEDLVLVSSGGTDWLKSSGTAVKVEGGSISDARVALTNMADKPVRATAVEQALVGAGVDEAAIRDACASAAEGTSPPSDLNGDADYRRAIAPVLTRRAVLAAAGA
jgi:hypothetical protein